MILHKTPEEVEAMASAGEIVAGCLAMLRGMCSPGVTTEDLDHAGDKFIRARGGEPAFLGYRGFPKSICTSPNSMVVHGIPGDFELSAGDVISICPPLIIQPAEIDELFDKLGKALDKTLDWAKSEQLLAA